jgi:predicted Zn-dependent protease with MMP-like domain
MLHSSYLGPSASLPERREEIKRGPVMSQHTIAPPSLSAIEALAREALADIPEALTRHIGNIVIRIEEFPDEEVERAMGLESPFDILGLYRGVALPHKSVSAISEDLDMIFLYRRPILDYWCETGEDLYDIVHHVMVHEIGHHFGFSDDDMERLESED